MNIDFMLASTMQGLGYAFLALGIFLSLRIFNIPDITTDGSYTLGGAITAIMLVHDFPPLLVLPVAVTGGMVAGAATGIIHTRWNIHPLLAGILVMTALYSVNLTIMGRSNIPLENNDIFTLLPLSWQQSVFILFSGMVVIMIFVLTWFLKTDFGIAMRITGDNENMARAYGVNTSSMKITGLALANGLTALSGCLIAQYQGYADINMGLGIVIAGLGSAMIGETIAGGGAGKSILYSIVAVVAGSILFRWIIAFALSTGLDPNYLKLITSLIVLVIVVYGRKYILR